MISLEEARQKILSHVGNAGVIEVGLADAWGGILAEQLVADAYYPTADRSTMDGYVIGGDEVPGTFHVIGEIPAGTFPEIPLGKGEALRIFTGALIPQGGGRVVMQEDVTRDGDHVSIKAFSENRFIREKGSEAAPGDVVLEKGTKLGGAELAILAQIGEVRPKILRKPVVRHIATGSELVAPDQIPGRGEIRDTNSNLLAGLFKSLGVEISDSRRVADDPQAISEIAEGDWDLLLISGGASVGDYDFGAETLKRLGFTIHFDKVNLRPGKPLIFATRGNQVAFVIPGNPISHFVSFHVAIRLAVERLAGLPCHWNFLPLEIRGGEPLRPDPRDSFWVARVSVEDGKLFVTPKSWSTSGNTFSLAGTNALVRVKSGAPADGVVETLLLDLPESIA
ncbi:molybdopterin molybdotransferase MoeA [Luteolibacter yonseiensis]|uniref:Molybdopterin molybdenumtransferase n=1 Tax=Luteolibacter yonseiensis TaxID=1144680 RepID=A0A934R3S4_9BACT|nr:molybdopterin molybdotransferase MoeA [Luteolibacter yonseiensis]MBK1814765.1 molybdopterin molybdotransferase MoeA [Luteolibacter yonseiensis]